MRVPVGAARLVALGCAVAVPWAVASLAPAIEPEAAAPPMVRVQKGDGSTATGRLAGIGAAEVRLADAAGGETAIVLPVDAVRSVQRVEAAAETGRRILVTLVDGSTLTGDEFSWDGTRPAALARPEGRIEVPVARVRSVAVRPDAAAGGVPAWQESIPEGTASDLVVVGTEESHEFVECAIMGVSPETVTVVLDEETIPVKRSKVIGMRWLRADGAAAAGRLAVAVAGGSLKGDRVEWSPAGLVVDGEIRLPASLLAGVDYASGRTMPLAELVPERVAVEPWFGPLGRGVGLESFFAPRAVAARKRSGRQEPDAGHPGLIMRPRTVAVWRLPPDSRRFHAVVTAAGGPQTADAAVVVVAVDDRELFRRQVDGSSAIAADDAAVSGIGIPVEIDLTGGRRLTVTVDFASGGGIGGAVMVTEPVIER